MAPISNRNQNAKAVASKLPRLSIVGGLPIRKRTSGAFSSTNGQGSIPLVPVSNAVSVVIQREVKVAVKVVAPTVVNRRPSLAPINGRVTSASAKPPLKNNNFGSRDSRSIAGKDIRRSGVAPLPRVSNYGVDRSRFNNTGRPSGITPVNQNSASSSQASTSRKSLVQQQNDAGPIIFKTDQTALRSILTNQGVKEGSQRAESLAAQGDRPYGRKSIYCRKNNSIGGGMEEATQRLARALVEHGGRMSGVPEDLKPKTPFRQSMYRRQSTSKFGTSTPSSGSKLDRSKLLAAMTGSIKMDSLAPLTPLRHIGIGASPVLSFLGKTESAEVSELRKGIAQQTAAYSGRKLELPSLKNTPRLFPTAPSPSKAVRAQPSPSTSMASISRYARRTSMEIEEFYSQFSLNQLENELEMVTKQKKIIEKLLNEGVQPKATTSKAISEHRPQILAVKGLETIVEGKERESTSSTASSRNDSREIENKIDEEPEIDETNANTNTNSDDETDSDEEVVPAKIRTRRIAQPTGQENLNTIGYGMKLRPRCNRLGK